MKIHGTAKGGALSKKDFGVAFGGAAPTPDPEFNSLLTNTDYWVFNDASMGSIDTDSNEIDIDLRSDGTNNWYGIDLEQAGIFGADNLSQTDFDVRWNQYTNTAGLYAGWNHSYSGFSSSSQATPYNSTQYSLCTNFDNAHYYTGGVANGTWYAPNDGAALTFLVNVRYYWELKLRDGDTLTLTNFSNSNYTTAVDTSITTGTEITNAMAGHMRYWKMGNWLGTESGGDSFPVDCAAPYSFYNGVRP